MFTQLATWMLCCFGAMALACFAHAETSLPIDILIYEHAPQDRLEVKTARVINGEELAIGSIIEITGNYVLGSVKHARLGLSISSREKGGKHVWQAGEIIPINTGKGTFTLRRQIERHGEIHVSIYPETPSGIPSASTSRLVFIEFPNAQTSR
ncbi:hypothetical protein [Cerasicoccus maritimus]|uniref:hypothetical protein n=1 Tax=Cerasicoccus maritimus TaxID=490089 RepID=UPI002852A552|nr:hypothetical protein [Cerasicoccus maritimus]